MLEVVPISARGCCCHGQTFQIPFRPHAILGMAQRSGLHSKQASKQASKHSHCTFTTSADISISQGHSKQVKLTLKPLLALYSPCMHFTHHACILLTMQQTTHMGGQSRKPSSMRACYAVHKCADNNAHFAIPCSLFVIACPMLAS